MQAIVGNVLTYYRNLSVKTKLLLAYLVLLFIPILTLSTYSIIQNTRMLTTQAAELSEQYFAETESKLETLINKASGISAQLAQDSEIKKALEKENRAAMPFGEEYDVMNSITQMITDVTWLYGLYQVRIYISSDFMHSKSNYITFNIDHIKGEAWFQDMQKGKYSQTILKPYSFKPPFLKPVQLVSVVSAIRNGTDYSDILGVVYVDIPVQDIISILNSSNFNGHKEIYLMDNEKNGILSNQESGTDEIRINRQAVELLQNKISSNTFTVADERSSNSVIEGNRIYNISDAIYNGWRILSVYSLEEFLGPAVSLRRNIVVLSIVVGVVAYLLAYAIGKYNTVRIKQLGDNCREAESGNLETRCIVDSADEIGNLQMKFNFMIGKMQELLNEQYRMGAELKESELRVLQEQINPHFLYNTLDLIAWKANDGKVQEIVDVVTALAQYYRITLSKGQNFISLKEEFQHVLLYVQLQNRRLENPIEMDSFLEPSVEDFKIMKLTLQPFIENCIVHGILASKHQSDGKIVLHIKKIGENIHIMIGDNGAGMPKNIIDDVLYDSSAENHYGFGMKNTLKRLRVYYGEDYHVDIKSEENKGTIIRIILPGIKKTE